MITWQPASGLRPSDTVTTSTKYAEALSGICPSLSLGRGTVSNFKLNSLTRITGNVDLAMAETRAGDSDSPADHEIHDS
jgi:hypothetical protein